MIRALDRANRCPFSPAQRRSEPIEAACPTHSVETAGRTTETVVFGATVAVIEQASQSKKQYTLVGQDEADMKFNKISVQSPVGRALIGKRVGDFVEVSTPAKVVEYEVVEIKFEEL